MVTDSVISTGRAGVMPSLEPSITMVAVPAPAEVLPFAWNEGAMEPEHSNHSPAKVVEA